MKDLVCKICTIKLVEAAYARILDVEARTMTALGPPQELVKSGNENVRRFLTRGKENGAAGATHG